LSAILSAAAVTISISTFAASRRRDRRDLFLRVHERLVTTEQQESRRLIHELGEQGKRVEDYTDDERARVNNALAAFNVLGIYYKRRYIRRKDVLEFWAVPLLRLMPSAEPYLKRRDSFGTTGQEWPELRALVDDSQRFIRRHGREGAVRWMVAPEVTQTE
jgi:hypothetical protein